MQQIVPDTKDWTWVLDRVCDECGYDAKAIGRPDVPSVIRQNAAEWLQVLATPEVRRRPDPQTWSPLEYGCHVRDVFQIFDQRLQLMLEEPDPLFPNWDQDATAVADRYWEQDPVVVSRHLLESADASPDGSPRSTGGNGTVPGGAATVPRSRWTASPGTSCTTRCTTCTTSTAELPQLWITA